MSPTYHQLDLAERRTIFRLLNAIRTPVAVIAQELGRHRSTIHREINRNHFHGQREYAGYYPLNAQDWPSSAANVSASSAETMSCAQSCRARAPAGRPSRSPDGSGMKVPTTVRSAETIYRLSTVLKAERRVYRHVPKARRRRQPRYGRGRAVVHPPDPLSGTDRRGRGSEDLRSLGGRSADIPPRARQGQPDQRDRAPDALHHAAAEAGPRVPRPDRADRSSLPRAAWRKPTVSWTPPYGSADEQLLVFVRGAAQNSPRE